MGRDDVITTADGLPDELRTALACISGAHQIGPTQVKRF
jgi:hypothetical protein